VFYPGKHPFRRGTKRKDGVPFNPARHSAQTRHAYKGDGLVANLESDIIGRVNRLALRPTEKNALMPLMEAVSNSVHSITDLYAGLKVEDRCPNASNRYRATAVFGVHVI
jgi:hypothetical protein